jgi:microsomal epoxide hydrolase
MFKKPQPEDYLKRLVDASIQVPADTAALLIYNMLAIKDYSAGFARTNRPVLFAYQPDTQPGADFLKSKLGEKVRLEKFDGDGHALFVDDPEKFNRVLEEFVRGLPQRTVDSLTSPLPAE